VQAFNNARKGMGEGTANLNSVILGPIFFSFSFSST